jgi:hypothetical protein
MTDSQALAEARRRWGRRAIVIHFEACIPQWAMPYAVGVRKGWIDNEILGYGMSWEQAFAAADERERCASLTSTQTGRAARVNE